MSNKKTAFIIVRVLEEEKQKILDKAAKVGLNISDFVREKLGINEGRDKTREVEPS